MMSASHNSEVLLKDNNDRAATGDFSKLQELHIVLCCHKAIFTEWSAYGMMSMIRACGGHGYSQFSGIPFHMGETFANMILEGENSILILQVSRYLLKCAKKVMKGKGYELGETVKYINKILEANPTVPVSKEALHDLPTLLVILERASLNMVKTGSTKMMTLIKQGIDPKEVWDYHMGSMLAQMGRMHAIYSIFNNALERMKVLPESLMKDVISNVARFFAYTQIKLFASQVMESSIIGPAHLTLIQDLKE